MDENLLWKNVGYLKTIEDLKAAFRLRYNLHFSPENETDFKFERIANCNTAIQIMEQNRKYSETSCKKMHLNLYVPPPMALIKKTYSHRYSPSEWYYLTNLGFEKLYTQKGKVRKVDANTSAIDPLPSTLFVNPSNTKTLPMPEDATIFQLRTDIEQAKEFWGKVLKDKTYETKDYINVHVFDKNADEEEMEELWQEIQKERTENLEAQNKSLEKEFGKFLDKKMSERVFLIKPCPNRDLECIRQLLTESFKGKLDVENQLTLFVRENGSRELLNYANTVLFSTMKANQVSKEELVLFNERVKSEQFLIFRFVDPKDLFNLNGHIILRELMDNHFGMEAQINRIFYLGSTKEEEEEEETRVSDATAKQEFSTSVREYYSDLFIKKAASLMNMEDREELISDFKKKMNIQSGSAKEMTEVKNTLVRKAKYDLYEYGKIMVKKNPDLQSSVDVYNDFVCYTFNKVHAGDYVYLFEEKTKTIQSGLSGLLKTILTSILVLFLTQVFGVSSSENSFAKIHDKLTGTPSNLVDNVITTVERQKRAVTFYQLQSRIEKNKTYKIKTKDASAIIDNESTNSKIGMKNIKLDNKSIQEYANRIEALLLEQNSVIFFEDAQTLHNEMKEVFQTSLNKYTSGSKTLELSKSKYDDVQALFKPFMDDIDSVRLNINGSVEMTKKYLKKVLNHLIPIADFYRNGLVFKDVVYTGEKDVLDGIITHGELLEIFKQNSQRLLKTASDLLVEYYNYVQDVLNNLNTIDYYTLMKSKGNTLKALKKEEFEEWIKANTDAATYDNKNTAPDEARSTLKRKYPNYFFVYINQGFIAIHPSDNLYAILFEWAETQNYVTTSESSLNDLAEKSEKSVDNSFRNQFNISMKDDDIKGFIRDCMLRATKELLTDSRKKQYNSKQEIESIKLTVENNTYRYLTEEVNSDKYVSKKSVFYRYLRNSENKEQMTTKDWYFDIRDQLKNFVVAELGLDRSTTRAQVKLEGLTDQKNLLLPIEANEKRTTIDTNSKTIVEKYNKAVVSASEVQNAIYTSMIMEEEVKNYPIFAKKNYVCAYELKKIPKVRTESQFVTLSSMMEENVQKSNESITVPTSNPFEKNIPVPFREKLPKQDKVENGVTTTQNDRSSKNIPGPSLPTEQSKNEIKLESIDEFVTRLPPISNNNSYLASLSNFFSIDEFPFYTIGSTLVTAISDYTGLSSFLTFADVLKNASNCVAMGASLDFHGYLGHWFAIFVAYLKLEIAKRLSRRVQLYWSHYNQIKLEYTSVERSALFVAGLRNFFPYYLTKKWSFFDIASVTRIILFSSVTFGLSNMAFQRISGTPIFNSVLPAVHFGSFVNDRLNNPAVHIFITALGVGFTSCLWATLIGMFNQISPKKISMNILGTINYMSLIDNYVDVLKTSTFVKEVYKSSVAQNTIGKVSVQQTNDLNGNLAKKNVIGRTTTTMEEKNEVPTPTLSSTAEKATIDALDNGAPITTQTKLSNVKSLAWTTMWQFVVFKFGELAVGFFLDYIFRSVPEVSSINIKFENRIDNDINFGRITEEIHAKDVLPYTEASLLDHVTLAYNNDLYSCRDAISSYRTETIGEWNSNPVLQLSKKNVQLFEYAKTEISKSNIAITTLQRFSDKYGKFVEFFKKILEDTSNADTREQVLKKMFAEVEKGGLTTIEADRLLDFFVGNK